MTENFEILGFARHGRRRAGGVAGVAAMLLVALALTACSSAPSKTEPVRAVLSRYEEWTIRVTPSLSDRTSQWRARVEVWPPERSFQVYPGILVRFTDSASDQKAVVESALEAARRYIDASRSQHQ